MADDKLQSVDEAARRLAVSRFTVRRLVKTNQLGSVRVGKRLLILESEIQRVMREGCGKYARNT